MAIENFDSQEYRDELAKNLKSVSDHSDRREALEIEKFTGEYPKASKEKKTKRKDQTSNRDSQKKLDETPSVDQEGLSKEEVLRIERLGKALFGNHNVSDYRDFIFSVLSKKEGKSFADELADIQSKNSFANKKDKRHGDSYLRKQSVDFFGKNCEIQDKTGKFFDHFVKRSCLSVPEIHLFLKNIRQRLFSEAQEKNEDEARRNIAVADIIQNILNEYDVSDLTNFKTPMNEMPSKEYDIEEEEDPDYREKREQGFKSM